MAQRAKPVVVSTRASVANAAIISAAAAQDGVTKADFIHDAVVTAARMKLGIVGNEEGSRAA